MTDFPYHQLRRYPDIEAPNLQAHDATDTLLVREALRIYEARQQHEQQAATQPPVVIGDRYGAIALALQHAGIADIRVHHDDETGRRALAANARMLGMQTPTMGDLDADLLAGATLVIVQLPTVLSALEEIADAIARWADPAVTVIAGGRVKHMTLGQNDILARYFHRVQPQRAERKSRLVIASDARPVAPQPPFPTNETHTLPGVTQPVTLYAYGGVFAGPRLDIGTRVLLDCLPRLRREYASDRRAAATSTMPLTAVDMGCGTGALAVAFALQHPDATVWATDRSAAAVRSTRATVRGQQLEHRIIVTLDDAGSRLPEARADIVLLNPPFHVGASVHEGAGRRLIEASGRLLAPGGQIWTVFNSHLDHKQALTALVGPTEQIHRTPKFTVTRTVLRAK
ncbi:class I SAM-dependent methyltransferase [Microbacterium sp. YY-01]|uniref:class I SAM-dependent methyltransferase n=1 Tax=Microbacterium sp. YY-01 TaxID=3421634 RepID=UPI003D168E62